MSDAPIRPRGLSRSRGRRVIGRDIDQATYDAEKAVAGRLHDIQVLFDCGKHDLACSDLMVLIFASGRTRRTSSMFRTIETARVVTRARNSFGEPWNKSEPDHAALANLNEPDLFDDVLLSKLIDPLGYVHAKYYRRAPFATNEVFRNPLPSPNHGVYRGVLNPGYANEDVQIRRRRARALVEEYGADNNLSQFEINRLLVRCEPVLDDDDPRLKYYGGP